MVRYTFAFFICVCSFGQRRLKQEESADRIKAETWNTGLFKIKYQGGKNRNISAELLLFYA